MTRQGEERLWQQLQDAEEEKPIEEVEPPADPKPDNVENDKSGDMTVSNFLAHHDTHPLVLDAACLKAFQTDWLWWEPEIIHSELRRVFGQSTISTLNWQQIQACKTCHVVPTPWKEWEVFNTVIMALNNNIPDFHTMQKPSIAQVMVGLDIMSRIDSRQMFSEEVEKFIAAVFLEDGVYFMPPPADFAQEWASRPEYRCRRCGRIDRDDMNDMCDSCGAPDSELERQLAFDPAPVMARYNECVRLGNDREDMLEETIIDVQTAKLLLAREYMLFRRQQLEDQLKVVNDAKPIRD